MSRTDGGIYTASNIWAENGEKEDPSFTETDGWDVTYSQAGGNPVERELMNRNFFKASACLYDVNRYGANLIWSSSASLTYEIGAVVTGSDGKNYRAKVANTGIDPVSDSGTNWEYLSPVITGDANVTVNKDARNNVSLGLSSNLSDKANKSLNNVTSGTLLGRFDNTSTISWSVNGSNIKADFIGDLSIYALKTMSNVIGSDFKTKFLDSGTIVWTVVGNQVQASFQGTLDNYALKTMSNVVGSDFKTKFLDSGTVTWQASASQVTGNVNILAIANILFPVGCVHSAPILQGQGMNWYELPEGAVLMTANASNNTQLTGGNRADVGNTVGHAITEAEMPSHTHGYTAPGNTGAGGGGYSGVTVAATTTATGGNQPHVHSLNIYNYKVRLWRRIS